MITVFLYVAGLSAVCIISTVLLDRHYARRYHPRHDRYRR
jgi:hypothetical protein